MNECRRQDYAWDPELNKGNLDWCMTHREKWPCSYSDQNVPCPGPHCRCQAENTRLAAALAHERAQREMRHAAWLEEKARADCNAAELFDLETLTEAVERYCAPHDGEEAYGWLLADAVRGMAQERDTLRAELAAARTREGLWEEEARMILETFHLNSRGKGHLGQYGACLKSICKNYREQIVRLAALAAQAPEGE